MDKKKFVEDALEKAYEEEKKHIKSIKEIKEEDEEFMEEEKKLRNLLDEEE